jgi:hypothetical protein
MPSLGNGKVTTRSRLILVRAAMTVPGSGDPDGVRIEGGLVMVNVPAISRGYVGDIQCPSEAILIGC